jgi:hypothetical protein
VGGTSAEWPGLRSRQSVHADFVKPLLKIPPPRCVDHPHLDPLPGSSP